MSFGNDVKTKVKKNPVTVRKNTLEIIWDTCRKMAYFIKATTQSCKSYITVFHTVFVSICLPFEKFYSGRKV